MAAYYFVDVRKIKDAAKMAYHRARITAVVEKRWRTLGGDRRSLASGRRLVSARLPSLDPISHSRYATPRLALLGQ